MDDPRLLIALVVGCVLIIALLVGLFSLIRGCVNTRAQKKKEADANTDTRVSLSISSSMAEQYTAALDRNDLLAQIAQNADAVGDERLLQLALDEPTAIEFVAGYLSNDTPKGAQEFTDGVSKGYYPVLYNWDQRWGYVTYGDGPIAITGSGPTAFAMAYMGLLGKTDQTPSSLAALAVQHEKTDKVYGTSAEFFTEVAGELGLSIEEYSANGDTLSELLESGTVVLVQLRERSVTDDAHWALAVSKNLDGSINLYDPTSTVASNHPWDPASIASGADAFYSLSAAPEDSGEGEGESW